MARSCEKHKCDTEGCGEVCLVEGAATKSCRMHCEENEEAGEN